MNQLLISNDDIPLHAAIKRNDLEEAASLLSQGANIAEKNKYGQNAFHIAALTGNREVLKLLLDTNPSTEVINARDEYGNTPFHFACREADEQTAALLFNTENIDLQNLLGYTALHLASKENKSNMVNFLLSKKANVNVLDNNQNSPLHLAIKNGLLEVVTILLEVPNICVNAQNAEKDTPLFLAANLCSLDLIKHLAAKGAAAGIDKALYYAAEQGWKEGIKYLFDLCQYQYQDSGICVPLKFAIEKDYAMLAKLFFAKDNRFYSKAFGYSVEHSNLNAVKYILSKYPQFINQNCQGYGEPPLFLAVNRSSYEVVNFLIDYVEDINVKHHGVSILNAAAYNRHHGFEIINLLIAKGAKPIEHMDYRENTPLGEALRVGSLESAKAFLQNGADLSLAKGRRSNIIHAMDRHQPGQVIDKLKFLQEFIKYGFDLNEKNRQGLTFVEELTDSYRPEPAVLAYLYSLVDTGVNLSSARLRKALIEKTDLMLKTKDGVFAAANIFFNFVHSANLEDQHFAKQMLSTMPEARTSLEKILDQEDKEIQKMSKEIKILIKRLNTEDKSSTKVSLGKETNKLFESLYQGEILYKRGKAMKNKVEGILNDDSIDKVLPKISNLNEKIKVPISKVIQINIDKWSELSGKSGSKTPIFKLQGNNNAVCSKISSFLNHDELESFFNTIPLGTIPRVVPVQEDTECDRATKRPKEGIFEDDTGISRNAEDYALLTGLDSDGDCL
ncbi:hypothetical protein phytr_5190 [Candidatus Phycorickettsia trachydisci]|uniref:Uncharacterized protein n=1 Tax=Candidatus Phycorickettsia trachydisci TaxID=2115978 RepID=A0A2P1P892_9RICK|nr:ankyrin repeat domain-containing protein [Candidatus Phycorickettsia trachydisci]AVP87465.1 hypothetical protein phytr_5190 [Candidatus Phycorickettsia trachydisci]